MYQAYRVVCNNKQLRPGMILPYSKLCPAEGLAKRKHRDEPLILNFAVKDHWRDASRYSWVEDCLKRFVDNYERLGVNSAAFPWIGAMNGRLDMKRVREIMLSHLEPLPIPIEIYNYDVDVAIKQRP